MIYRCSTQNGAPPVIREYTAGGDGAAGDLVVFGAEDTVTVATADATAALGWLTGAADSGASVHVMEANDNTVVEMPWTGTLPEYPLGAFYGLAVDATGAQAVDMGETTSTLFKLLTITRNGAATGHAAGDQRCLVMIPSAKSQAVTAA